MNGSWFPPDEAVTITDSDPPRLLAGTWFGDRLRLELRPDGEGCVLVFSHIFDDRETAARSAAGWDSSLLRLDALIAGEPLGYDDSLEPWPEVRSSSPRSAVLGVREIEPAARVPL